MGNKGFSGPASLMYHIRRPTSLLRTQLLDARPADGLGRRADPDPSLRMRHFRLAEIAPSSSATLTRTPILFNQEVALAMVCPTQTDDFFYRNAGADELLYLAQGSGVLESQMGTIAIRAGDYVVIPRGIIHRLRWDSNEVRVLVIESVGAIRTPKRYRNEFGQMMEHAPFCERDIRVPESLPVVDQVGEFRIVVKQNGQWTDTYLDHHPFDVVGWDGYYYPWALSIHDFEPIVGSLHQPPPVHQTFEGDGFVVCSFCPRLFDFHPEAIPAPYNHSNADSDEVLFYANEEFMSRKGIGFGSLTLHPDGLPHGPQPGRMEASIGKKETRELAVMVDTFRPLTVAQQALAVEDHQYGRSWLED
jgi:homogentisate 1,2-dioxygenase